MGTVAGRLGKAHAVMGAKDALLAQLHKKLKASPTPILTPTPTPTPNPTPNPNPNP